MNLTMIQRIMGLLLMVFSFSMLPPVGVGWLLGDIEFSPFIHGFFNCFNHWFFIMVSGT